MDTETLAKMMAATLSQDKTERETAEEQLNQVKQHTMCFWKEKKMQNSFDSMI